MPLERQIKQFFFGKGISSRVTHEATPLGELHIMENARFDSPGKISKTLPLLNLSTSAKSPTGTVSNGQKLINFNDQLLYIADNSAAAVANPTRIFSYNAATDTFLDTNIGLQKGFSPSSIIIDNFAIGRQATSLSYSGTDIVSETVILSSRTFTAISKDSDSNCILVEVDKNSKSARLITTVNGVGRLISFLGKLYLLSKSDAAAALSVTEFDPSNETLTTVGTIAGFLAAPVVFDVEVDAVNSKVYIAFKNAAGQITINSYTSLNAITLSNTVAIAVAIGVHLAIAVITSGSAASRVYVGYSNAANTAVSVEIYTLALVLSVGAHVPVTGVTLIRGISMGGPVSVGSYCPVYVSYQQSVATAGTPANFVSDRTETNYYNTAGFFSAPTFFYNLLACSKPGGPNNNHIWFKGLRGNQECLYLFYNNATNSPLVLGKALYGLDAGVNSTPLFNAACYLPRISSVDAAGNYYFTGARVSADLGDFPISNKIVEASLVTFNLTDPKKFQHDKIAESVCFAGGYPWQFDGESYSEIGFPEYPDSLGFVYTLPGGAGPYNGPAASSYAFVHVFEYVDANGKIHLSAPSVAVSIVAGGGGFVNARIAQAFYNGRGGAAGSDLFPNKEAFQIRSYRTVNNGSTFYFDGYYSVALPDTYESVTTDAQLISQEILYTQSGELSNINPGATQFVCTWKDRLWGIFERGVLKYSKKVEGNDPVEFADELEVVVESSGGIPIALAAFQDKLIIFKKERIYYLVGDGPNDTGTFGDFSQPQLVNTGYGCIDPMSVISHGNFIYFHAKEGMCRLAQNLSVEVIGTPLSYWAETSVGVLPTIISATVFATEREIRWIARISSFNDIIFIFNFETLQWSTRKSTGYTQYQDISVIDNVFYAIGTDGTSTARLRKESLSGIETLKMTVSTGWINLDQIEGFQRLYRIFLLGQKKANSDLACFLAYDYIPTLVEQHDINELSANSNIYTEADIYDANSLDVNLSADQTLKPMQYCIRPKRQKCQSVKIVLQELTASVQSLELVGISFEIGFKRVGVKTWIGDSRNI